jgi:hypothetical protein
MTSSSIRAAREPVHAVVHGVAETGACERGRVWRGRHGIGRVARVEDVDVEVPGGPSELGQQRAVVVGADRQRVVVRGSNHARAVERARGDTCRGGTGQADDESTTSGPRRFDDSGTGDRGVASWCDMGR